MPASVGYLVIDATGPERLARFWCGLLDVGVETTIGDGQFVVLSATKDGFTVGFQRVREGKAATNRLHLDLIVGDLDQATAEVETLGGRWLEPGNTRELEGFRWRCMADPEGNEFDIDVLPSG
ncbi:MAG TPA: VOC family protein [Streptosporangiaceae bacterium]|nr:VOC family protein [Streptosporangiaceae bacterium]